MSWSHLEKRLIMKIHYCLYSSLVPGQSFNDTYKSILFFMKIFEFQINLHWLIFLRVSEKHESVKIVLVWLIALVHGWGLLSQFPPFRYFLNVSALSKHKLDIEYHLYIWQVSPQLICGDTCQIWMWFKEFSRCYCTIENFDYGEINERSFSNPHPR